MRRTLIFLITLFYSCFLPAEDQPLNYCSMAGYFEGEHSEFYNDLVTGLISKNNLSSDPICKAELKRGKEAAIYYIKHGTFKNDEDKFIVQQAATYKAKVRVFINKGIGLH